MVAVTLFVLRKCPWIINNNNDNSRMWEFGYGLKRSLTFRFFFLFIKFYILPEVSQKKKIKLKMVEAETKQNLMRLMNAHAGKIFFSLSLHYFFPAFFLKLFLSFPLLSLSLSFSFVSTVLVFEIVNTTLMMMMIMIIIIGICYYYYYYLFSQEGKNANDKKFFLNLSKVAT